MRSLLLGLFGCLWLVSCGSQLETRLQHLEQDHATQIQQLNEKVRQLEQALAAQEQMATEQLTRVRQELQALREQLDTLTTTSQTGQTSLRNHDINIDSQLELLSDEMKKIEGKLPGGAPLATATAAVPAAAAGNTVDTAEFKKLYDQGTKYYREKKYQEAIAVFSQLTTVYGSSDLADNAQFWTGECFLKLENYQDALRSFELVLIYHKSNKIEDALMKMGQIYLKTGDKAEALTVYKKIVDEFPQSAYIKEARKKIDELGKSLGR